MGDQIRHLVSKKKKRFIEDGFDLDLAYIKPNIIAMGFPSEGTEGMYRNHLDDVLRFLEQRHKDRYKIYNLCSEKKYDPAKFGYRVSHYGFDDHNAPPFELIQPCCADMGKWLDAHQDNIAIVHCKAGKGRTGVMISAYLLYKKYFNGNAIEAMNFYADARTHNSKGVTIPSQRRYITYFGYYTRNNFEYIPKTILLNSVTFIGVPTFNSGTCSPSLVIFQTKVMLYKSKSMEVQKNQEEIPMEIGPNSIPICGDVRIDVFHKDLFKKERMLVFWFNTYFLERGVTFSHPDGGGIKQMGLDVNGDKVIDYTIEKSYLDKANKDKKHKLFPDTFAVRLNITIPMDKGDGSGNVDNTETNKETTPTFKHSTLPTRVTSHVDGVEVVTSASLPHHTSTTLPSNASKDNGKCISKSPKHSKALAGRSENSTFYTPPPISDSRSSDVVSNNQQRQQRNHLTSKDNSNGNNTTSARGASELRDDFRRLDVIPDTRLSKSIEDLRFEGRAKERYSDSDSDDEDENEMVI